MLAARAGPRPEEEEEAFGARTARQTVQCWCVGRAAKAPFTYSGSSSEVSEELYSDSAAKLSKGIGKVFDAMLSCPSYQVTSGSTVVDIGSEKSAAPDLGDEQWSQLLTFSAGGQRSVVKQTAIRTGNILVIVSGAPGLVDAHLDKAIAKAGAVH